jgi:hypothetical protein
MHACIDNPLFYALDVAEMQEKQVVLPELESAVKNFDRQTGKKAFKFGMAPVEAIEKELTKGLREVGDAIDSRGFPAPFTIYTNIRILIPYPLVLS